MSDRDATRADLEQLRAFVEARTGVEAFVEPKTSVTQTTILLVAADGEWIRRRIPSPQAAADFARKQQIPVYDANRVGYPQRMRDWNERQSKAKASTSRVPPQRPAAPNPRRMAAIMTLESIAGAEPLADNPSDDDLMRLYRRARSQAHPDRVGGARDKWDTVEEAARTLGLPD